MKKILITGGSGLVGRALSRLLQSNGYEVAWLTRKKNSTSGIKQYVWDYRNKKIDWEAIGHSDGIIHLAGASINGKRWNKSYKKEIYDSRILSTEFLYECVASHSNKLKTFVCASGTGYYGLNTSEKIFKETDLPGNDFLSQTCVDWEKAAQRFSGLGIRTVRIRSGIAFSEDSEAFKKIVAPLRFHLGAVIGNGKQFFPWIYLDDLCGIYVKALEDEKMYGAFNALAPEHLSYRQLLKMISKHDHKSLLLLPIPTMLLRIVLGEITDSIINGSRISFEKIIDNGYQFNYPTLESALTKMDHK